MDEPVETPDKHTPDQPALHRAGRDEPGPDTRVRARPTVSFESAPVPIVCALGLLGLCVLTGAIVTALGFQDLRVARASAAWPSTRGIVMSAAPAASPASPGRGLRYRYNVDGRSYESGRVAFGPEPAELVRSYRTGGEVIVHYDSGRPDIAVLQPGGSLLRMDPSFYVALVSLLGGAGGLGWLLPRIAWRT